MPADTSLGQERGDSPRECPRGGASRRPHLVAFLGSSDLVLECHPQTEGWQGCEHQGQGLSPE